MTGYLRQSAQFKARHEQPCPRALARDVEQALRLAARELRPLVVRDDEHPAYPRALSRLCGFALRYERASSRWARTVGKPLFPGNRADLLLRN